LIGSLQMELHLHSSQSLKEKRFVVKSLISKIRNKFNVSVAEVDFLDKWQRTCIGVAIVSNSKRLIDSVFNEVIGIIEKDMRVQLIDKIIEVL